MVVLFSSVISVRLFTPLPSHSSPKRLPSFFCALTLRAPSVFCFGFCLSLRRALLSLPPAPWQIRILLASLLTFFQIQFPLSSSPMLTLWRSPSHKVTHPLSPALDPARLSGPNFLKWKRFVETTLRARQLFKHCTAPPLPVTHAHYAAWDAEEQFILGWLVTHTLTPEFHDHFPHQKTVKCFWDQAQAFCGLEDDNWQLFSCISRALALRQGTLTISDYFITYQAHWDEVDYYMPTDDPTCLSYRNFLKMRLLTFLNGLNREYAEIRKRALRCKEGLPTFASLVKELKEEESHSLLHGASITDIARDSSALLT